MTAAPLVDGFGRTVRDLRISITDRCNFRCTYCMPAEGMTWLPREDLLTFEEIERIARVCVSRFGFDGIRLTGGEPTVRAHLPVLVERLAMGEGRRLPDGWGLGYYPAGEPSAAILKEPAPPLPQPAPAAWPRYQQCDREVPPWRPKPARG